LLDNRALQKAEVLSFFGKFDEAEAVLIKAERKDLAI
jgi:hypothetical protein